VAEIVVTPEKGEPMKDTPAGDAKTLRLAALRPIRLQDPLLDNPVKTSPIPIYV
jgi:hypothetical protein